MNITFAAAAPDFRDRYREQTSAFLQSKDLKTRFGAARDRAQAVSDGWGRTSVAVRNLVLRDALNLLMPPDNEAQGLGQDWSFVELAELQRRLDQLRSSPADASDAAADGRTLGLLDDLIQRAKQDTYADFAVFRQAQQDFSARTGGELDDDLALQRYDSWLKRYRPYLVLGVPLDDEEQVDAADAAVRERIGFFLSKNPDPSSASRYEDRLWTYVFDVRHSLRAATRAGH